MTEKDLDIAIEKCERIMECDTRTLKNPESENGWIFEKVYDLLKFLRKCQFETSERGDTNDLISRQAAIDALTENKEMINAGLDSLTLDYNMRRNEEQRRGQIDEDIETIKDLPSAQPSVSKTKIVGDVISRQAAITEFSCCELTPDGGIDANYAVDFLEQMPSAQPKWIPCTPETMPEREGRYVCTYTYDGKKDVLMFRFEDGDFLVPWYVETVTAWYKPLDPWEGEENGET